MVLICPRIHFYEINDQTWFPQYLREKVQSCLTLAWTFKVPLIQKTSPASLVATTLYDVLSSSVSQFTYVDFCAGAGGPTPFIERDLNAKLKSTGAPKSPPTPSGRITRSSQTANKDTEKTATEVKFYLTDLHPHVPDWTEAAKKSSNLSFVPTPVDAANAPPNLVDDDGKKVFRLFNLAFHHFEDDLARAILKNTLDTADGFAIFELQHRTISSLILILLMFPLFLAITPFYFWRSPGHLFFTYIIPIIPFVVVFDGLVSSLRTRSSEEVQALMKQCGAKRSDGWAVRSGEELHTWPIGFMSWVIGVKGSGIR